jgi:hypothetical protein
MARKVLFAQVFLTRAAALRLFLVMMHCLFQSLSIFLVTERLYVVLSLIALFSAWLSHTETMDLESVLSLLGNIMDARSFASSAPSILSPPLLLPDVRHY